MLRHSSWWNVIVVLLMVCMISMATENVTLHAEETAHKYVVVDGLSLCIHLVSTYVSLYITIVCHRLFNRVMIK